jgi:aryl-alcohol dehydrogenase-like predicted oxidoreductase
VHEGKVRYVGHSNFTAWAAADADWVARSKGYERFVSAQNEYSLMRRGAEAELLPACEHYGLGFLPYFPLFSGLLTGKYRRGEPPPEGSRYQVWSLHKRLSDDRFDVVEKLEAYAAEHGVTLLDVAIGYLAAQPAVASVIAGATTPEQVRANAGALRWQPSSEDLSALRELL